MTIVSFDCMSELGGVWDMGTEIKAPFVLTRVTLLVSLWSPLSIIDNIVFSHTPTHSHTLAGQHSSGHCPRGAVQHVQRQGPLLHGDCARRDDRRPIPLLVLRGE